MTAAKTNIDIPMVREISRPKPSLARAFSDVSSGSMRFLILDCPTTENLDEYRKQLSERGVTDIVRVCSERTYPNDAFPGIIVHDWPFPDGGAPPQAVVSSFLALCQSTFKTLSLKDDPDSGVIAVHCVAGLGRAPVLVALALIEAGMTPLDAVEFIRKRRRGAFNSIQLQYLMDTYKRQLNKKPFLFLRRSSSPNSVKETSPTREPLNIFNVFRKRPISVPSVVSV